MAVMAEGMGGGGGCVGLGGWPGGSYFLEFCTELLFGNYDVSDLTGPVFYPPCNITLL